MNQMNLIKKIIGLCFILMISACQALPLPINLPTPISTVPAGPPGTAPSLTSFPPSVATSLQTAPPVLRIESGDTALFNGDYELARQQYQTAFNDTTDNAVKAAALWGLGRTELADEQYQFAIDRLTNLISEYPDSTYAARAYFLMGRAYYQLGQFQASA